MQIELPWFNPVLNPNKKRHWAIKYKAAKQQKNTAFWIAQKAGGLPVYDLYLLSVVFYPPGNYGYDADNCNAACKSYYDGLALAWGVNDKQFRFNLDMGKPIKGGKVFITISKK